MIRVLLLISILSSCTLFAPIQEEYTLDDITSSLYSYTGTTISSRAVVPYWNSINIFESGSLENYPLQGQNTSWATTSKGSYYEIESITYYPLSDYIEELTEIYYIQPDYVYVDNNGNVNSLYRKKYETVYRDGSVRREEIVWDSNQTTQYNIEFLEDDQNIFTTAIFSSVVEYTQSTLDVDASSVRVDGKRAYSNAGNGQEHIWIFETGTFRNVLINGVKYHSVDVIAEIHVQILNKEIQSIVGSYTLTNSIGEVILTVTSFL